MRTMSAVLALVLSMLLAACGGGGGGGGGATTQACLPPMGNPTACDPQIAVAVVDGQGAAMGGITPTNVATLRATLKSNTGAPLQGVVVTFTTTDTTGVFVPSSGTALTDANGVATASLPPGTKVGAFTVKASASAGGITVNATAGYQVAVAGAGGAGGGTGALALTLTDPQTNTTTAQVSPDRQGLLTAVLRDASGAPAPRVAITFATTDKTGKFVPSSGTALTDNNGIATIGLPAGTQTGGFTVTATASVGGNAVSGSAGYAVAFPTLALSPLSIAPATLSAGGNAAVAVSVLSNGVPYTAPIAVSFSSPCVVAGKAKIGSPVLAQNGVARASYSDQGCGVPDEITATVALGDATVSRVGTIDVLPAAVGSIRFETSDTTNIALKGTGGFGRQEFATLTFRVFDKTGNRVSGALVDFNFADANVVGGLTLFPAFATSAADGTVTTLVTAGTIPTSIRVVASVRGSTPLITTLSNILVVSTGVPDQKHFSLSSSIGNCEGWDFDQFCTFVSAQLSDHFGNPAPDGTAVNFTAEGGQIGASCLTGTEPPPAFKLTPEGQSTNSAYGPGSGRCVVEMRSGLPRPGAHPLGIGRVTVLAFALGEENFLDVNGNNICDNCGSVSNVAGSEFRSVDDQSPDAFRDDNENFQFDGGEACVGPNATGDCKTPGDGRYNGVLRPPSSPAAQTQYISSQFVQLFSGSFARITFNPTVAQCAPADNTTDVLVTVTDENGNLMPAATRIEFKANFGGLTIGALPAEVTVNNVTLAVGEAQVIPTYRVAVPCGNGKFLVTVTTPNKVQTNEGIPIRQ